MFKWINAAVAAQDVCRRHEFPFAFIGGVAVQRWGEPRVTVDVDITLFSGFGGEDLKESPETMDQLKKLRDECES